MPTVIINYWAILVSAIAVYVLGALWYSPALFGNLWMKLSKMSHEELEKMKHKGMAKSYIGNFIATLVMAYVLSHFIDFANATTASGGAQAGFWSWLGFVAPVTLGMVLWEGKPFKLYLLNNAYNLISLLIMGAILAVWT